MRDPNRIDDVLAKVREVWYRNPDLRLTQLIGNLAEPGGNFTTDDYANLNEYDTFGIVQTAIARPKDMYYMEDDEFVERLEKVYG